MSFKCGTVKTNFHTHTTFADGKHSAREMILSAIEMGGEAIGFSEHGYTPMDHSWCMMPSTTEEYIKEIRALIPEYADRIKVYCGIEADYYTEFERSKFDYVIGSVHYVEKDGFYIPMDKSAKDTLDGIENYYGGDPVALARDYFSLVADVVRKTDADIIGHFDVIYKFNEKEPFFDENSKELIGIATDAIDALIPYGKPFEINTGAISRGYKTRPYPSSRLIDYIGARGGSVIMSSDSHNRETIYYALDEAYELLATRNFPKANILFYPSLKLV